jgi:hypothetical protein
MGRGETMRNNKPLDFMGHYVFSVSHFECYADWVDYDGDDDYIAVQVYVADSCAALMTRKFPTTMTLGEIKSGMAVFILKELQKMQTKVLNFWQQHVKP